MAPSPDHSGHPQGHLKQMLSELDEQGGQIRPIALPLLPKFEMLCELLRVGVLWGVALALVFGILSSCTNYGMDDIDNRETGVRSGLTLRTDYGTGCQYLVQRDIMIPRVDGTGKHVGCR